MLFFFLSLFISYSFAQNSPVELDPEKFTVCSVTINSDNEKNVFEAEVAKDKLHFNPIVELTNFGDNWFQKACDSKIRCDQLIISGHFGGSFFGSKNFSLSLDELEAKGCAKSCDGILSSPYETFLFGCNTLASKQSDSRTPDQYLQILLQDSIPREQAVQIVESRYGASGEDIKSRMSRAFGGSSKQLYGFSSIGPSGKSIEPFLKGYFAKSNLRKRLEKLRASRLLSKVEEANQLLAESMKSTAFTQCSTGMLEGDIKTKLQCGLRDEAQSIDARIDYVIEAFSQENYPSYIPAINQFLTLHPIEAMSQAQQLKLKEISDNKILRNQMLAIIKNTSSFDLLVKWAELSQKLGFIDMKQMGELIGSLLTKYLNRGANISERDLVCSLSEDTKESIANSLGELKSSSKTDYGYDIFACLMTKNVKVQLQYLEGLSNPSSYIRMRILSALSRLDLKNVDIQNALVDGLGNTDLKVRSRLASALQEAKPKDKDVQLKIVQALSETDRNTSQELAKTLKLTPVESSEVQLKLLGNLQTYNNFDQITIVSLFATKIPKDKKVQLELIGFLQDQNVGLSQEVSKALLEFPILDKDVQLLLTKELKNQDFFVRRNISLIFRSMKPTDKDVQLSLLEELQSAKSPELEELSALFQELTVTDKDVKQKAQFMGIKTAK